MTSVDMSRWRWVNGMVDTNGNRVLSIAYLAPVAAVSCAGGPVWHNYNLHDKQPNLLDPATRGCLLFSLLRDRFGPHVHVIPLPSGEWAVKREAESEVYLAVGSTEIEAMVRAWGLE